MQSLLSVYGVCVINPGEPLVDDGCKVTVAVHSADGVIVDLDRFQCAPSVSVFSYHFCFLDVRMR